MVALQMGKLGRHGMLFLAAAVSDFHVQRDKLREHKIDSSQEARGSGGAGLTLHLDEVRTSWGQDGKRRGDDGGEGEGKNGSGKARNGKRDSFLPKSNPAPFLASIPFLLLLADRLRYICTVSFLDAGGLFVQVPKCLGMIRAEWAPDCFRVSFKLETDLERLLPKARVALQK